MSAAGVFTFGTWNLGDEMQSCAVLAHLDRVQHFLDRDRLADFHADTKVHFVSNCWFLLGDDFRRPAPCLRPIWHGYATWQDRLQGSWLAYLRAQSLVNGPIGCRDLSTVELLAGLDIPAQWTGCLTLFLGPALGWKPAERSGVLFVDVPPEAEAFIPAEVVKRAVRLSTFPAAGILNQPLERWATMARLAQQLARAELVVTRRLHVALPAASFGTPVVAIPDPGIAEARRRFAGFERIIPVVFLNEAEAGLRRIDWRNVPPARVPAELGARHRELRERLRTEGLGGLRPLPASPLESVERNSQWLRNESRQPAPGALRLRLGGRVFDLAIWSWNDRYVEVALRGFPGLSKFDFVVEACPRGCDAWTSWGQLRDLAVTTGETGAGSD